MLRTLEPLRDFKQGGAIEISSLESTSVAAVCQARVWQGRLGGG